MRVAIAAGVLFELVFAGFCIAQPAEKPAAPGKDSPAAGRTRGRLLKLKVTVDFKKGTVRDLLKEFAAQVEMQAERPVMWMYAEGVAADTPVVFACKDKPLEEALGELFTAQKFGYVVVSDNDGPRDGWVRITKGNERGFAGGSDPAEEKKAAATLGVAQDLIDKGKPTDAKAVLMLVISKHPDTKAAAEARQLLEKIGK
jgi:hypothetical protein